MVLHKLSNRLLAGLIDRSPRYGGPTGREWYGTI